MPSKIDWIPSARASGFQTVAAVLQRLPSADADLAAALAEPAERLAEITAECGLPAELLMTELIPLSVQFDDDRRLVESAVARTGGSLTPAALDALCDTVTALRNAFDRAKPRVADELQFRGPVLREQWEAYGPGLLRAIGRLTDTDTSLPRAAVVLVHPFLGGGGRAFGAHRLVTFEAVLTNPVPELPEVVRLAWLLSQLKLDGNREPAAMICHAVAAAADLGLVRSGEETLSIARRAWYGDGG